MPGPVSCTEISNVAPIAPRRDRDRRAGRRVFDRILAQVGQHLGDLDVVEPGQGADRVRPRSESGVRVDWARSRPPTSSISSARSYHSRSGRRAPPSIRERSSRLVTIRVSRSVSSSIASRKSVRDSSSQVTDRSSREVAEALIAASGVREVVGDRRQEGGFQFVRLGKGSRLGRLFGQARPIQRQGRLGGEGAEQADILVAEGAASRPSRDLQNADRMARCRDRARRAHPPPSAAQTPAPVGSGHGAAAPDVLSPCPAG